MLVYINIIITSSTFFLLLPQNSVQLSGARKAALYKPMVTSIRDQTYPSITTLVLGTFTWGQVLALLYP